MGYFRCHHAHAILAPQAYLEKLIEGGSQIVAEDAMTLLNLLYCHIAMEVVQRVDACMHGRLDDRVSESEAALVTGVSR